VPVPRCGGESLAQKNLAIWHEPWEGMGDSILFLRYVVALVRLTRTGGQRYLASLLDQFLVLTATVCFRQQAIFHD
jgi:hypothetical protein